MNARRAGLLLVVAGLGLALVGGASASPGPAADASGPAGAWNDAAGQNRGLVLEAAGNPALQSPGTASAPAAGTATGGASVAADDSTSQLKPDCPPDGTVESHASRREVLHTGELPYSAIGHVETQLADPDDVPDAIKAIGDWDPEDLEVSGTGFVVSTRHVVTAAHVVSETDQPPESVTFTPGHRDVPRQTDAAPFRTYEVEEVRLHPDWRSGLAEEVPLYGDAEDADDDMALLRLEEPVGQVTGTMDFAAHSSGSSAYEGPFRQAGYPCGTEGTKLMETTNVDGDGTGTVHDLHKWTPDEIYGGDSGSPVWRSVDGTPTAYSVTVGTFRFVDAHGARWDHWTRAQFEQWILGDEPEEPKPRVIHVQETDLTTAPADPDVDSPRGGYPGEARFRTDLYNAGTAPAAGFDVTFHATEYRTALDDANEVCRVRIPEDEPIEPEGTAPVVCVAENASAPPDPETPVWADVDPDGDLDQAFFFTSEGRSEVGSLQRQEVVVEDVTPVVRTFDEDGNAVEEEFTEFGDHEPFDLNVTLRNERPVPGPAEVTVDSDVASCDTQAVEATLAGEETTSVRFDGCSAPGEADGVELRVSTGDDVGGATASLDPAVNTELSVEAPGGTVVGETLPVAVTVQNVRDWAVEETVSVTSSPLECESDSFTVQLGPGGNETVRIGCFAPPGSGDGLATVGATTGYASDTETVPVSTDGVAGETTFEVVDVQLSGLPAGVEHPDLEPGEAFELSGTVQNVGGEPGTRPVGFFVSGPDCANHDDGKPWSERPIALDPGETAELTFRCELPYDVDFGGESELVTRAALTVRSREGRAASAYAHEFVEELVPEDDGDGDTDVLTVHRRDGTLFQVDDVTPPDSATVGSPSTVHAFVWNDESPGVQTVRLLGPDGSVVDEAEVELDRWEGQPLYFEYEPGPGATGEQTLAVETDDTREEVPVDVTPAPFEVAFASVPDAVRPDAGSVDVAVALSNEGDGRDVQSVALRAGGDVVDVTEVSVGDGETETVSLGGQLPDDTADRLELAVETERGAARTTVPVARDSLRPTSLNAPSVVGANRSLPVDVAVTNDDPVDVTEEVELGLNGTTRHATSVTVGPNSTGAVSVDLDVSGLRGASELTARVGADVVASEVTVVDAEACTTLDGQPVCDTQGDGTYRDVTGDGEVAQDDVVHFFENQHRPGWKRPDLVDFSDSGDVGHGDVIAVFEYVVTA